MNPNPKPGVLLGRPLFSFTASMVALWLLGFPLVWWLSAGSQPAETEQKLQAAHDIVSQLMQLSLVGVVVIGVLAWGLRVLRDGRHGHKSLPQRFFAFLNGLKVLGHIVLVGVMIGLVISLLFGEWGNILLLLAAGSAWWHYLMADTDEESFAKLKGGDANKGDDAKSDTHPVEPGHKGSQGSAEPTPREILEEFEMARLGSEVRSQLRTIGNTLVREYETGTPGPELLSHLVLEGNPGTGKTTAAAWLARLYKAMGATDEDVDLLPTAHVENDLTSNPADLLMESYIAASLSEANPDTLDGQPFEKGRLILFEEPPLTATWLSALESRLRILSYAHRSSPLASCAFLLAGRKSRLDELFKTRPSLEDCFSRTIRFPDLTAGELGAVFRTGIERRDLALSPRGYEQLDTVSAQLACKAGPGWRNAHEMEDLLEHVLDARSGRLDSALDSSTVISAEDLQDGLGSYQQARQLSAARQGAASLPYQGKTVDELLDLLASKPGMKSVKDRVAEEAAMQQMQRTRQERGQDVQTTSNHLLFMGNPGTGKTTVAELLGAIYREMNVLPKGQLVVATRSDLVGEYQGHTAIKVQGVLERAMGGVLLIDEAYALNQGKGDSFGQEAIDELVGRIERPEVRASLVCILAGYTQDMEEFLESNPGLASRFPGRIEFPDYTPEELLGIAQSMTKASHLSLTLEAEELLAQGLEEMYHAREPRGWGNARSVRNLLEKADRSKARRFANEGEYDELLTVEDIASALGKDHASAN